MISLFRRIISSNRVKRVFDHSCKIVLLNVRNHTLRPANYSNVSVFNKVGPAVGRKNGLYYILKSRSSFQHNQAASATIISNGLEKFNNLLHRIEESQNNLSVDGIKSYVHEMTTLCEEVLLEDHHCKRVVTNKAFITLFKGILEKFDEMDNNDLIIIFNLWRLLRLPMMTSEITYKVISKLENNFENLDFPNKIEFFYCLLEYCRKLSMDNTFIEERLRPFRRKIMESLEKRTYLNSSKDTAFALKFINSNRSVFYRIEEEVISAVLGFKVWDHPFFFRYCLSEKFPNRLNEKYLKRIKEEVILPEDMLLSNFLVAYRHATEKGTVQYEKDFIDDIVNKLLQMKLRAPVIKSMVSSLSTLMHSHYGFVKYLLDFLANNSNIFVSHPYLSLKIIDYIAECNCNDKEQDLWSRHLQSILTNNPNFIYTLQFWRNDMNRYIYFLMSITSLEVFIDDELNHLTGVCRGFDLRKSDKKLWLFLLSLNQAVKLFYPSFSKPIVSDDVLPFVIKKFTRGSPRLNFPSELGILRDIEKHLKTTSNAMNCVLAGCFTKSGVRFDGVAAINNEGQFYDFGAAATDVIFIENVAVPTEYKLISLFIVSKEECSRNTLDLYSACALKLKIETKLGFPTVIIYENIFRNLNDNEKKDYLHQLIWKTISRKREAENYSL